VAGLDVITNAAEFQRADCAPRFSLGDGQIKVTDWVQAGRYAAGLDPLVLAGGPMPLVTPLASAPGAVPLIGPVARQVIVGDGTVVKGLPVTLPVNLLAQGDESALAFSLSFDPAVLRYVSTSKGSAAASATLNVNTNLAVNGELAIALMLPAGSSHFAAGTREVVKVTFIGVSSATNYSVGFADEPALRSISDTNAVELTATYVASQVTINPNPPLGISITDTNVVLSWPVWAADFSLQSADIAALPFAWTNVPVTVQTNGANVQATLPASARNSVFRLMHP
jgi:hypothetical protein